MEALGGGSGQEEALKAQRLQKAEIKAQKTRESARLAVEEDAVARRKLNPRTSGRQSLIATSQTGTQAVKLGGTNA